MFAPIILALQGLWSVFSGTIDKGIEVFKALAPLVWKFFMKWYKLIIFLIFWGVFINYIFTLVAFALYHLSIGAYLGLSPLCTKFTVLMVINSMIAILFFSVYRIFKNVIG